METDGKTSGSQASAEGSETRAQLQAQQKRLEEARVKLRAILEQTRRHQIRSYGTGMPPDYL